MRVTPYRQHATFYTDHYVVSQGVKFGRKRTVNRRQVLTMKSQHFGASAIAKQLNIGRSTVYKILSEANAASL